jgi:hypothetical protein
MRDLLIDCQIHPPAQGWGSSLAQIHKKIVDVLRKDKDKNLRKKGNGS